jgi:hypothetical protein
MAATRLSDSQKQELVARFCGGASLQQLAKLFGCSPTTVSRTAKAAIDLADYELLLQQLKAQRGGSAQGDGVPLGELPLEMEEEDGGTSPAVEAPNGFGDAIELGYRADLGTAVALTLTEPDAGPVELPAREALVGQQGATQLPGAQEIAGASATQPTVLPSPVAEAVAEPAVDPEVPRAILGRRRRSGAAPPSTPAPTHPETHLAPPDLAPVDTAPLAGPTPADLVAAAGPGELAIDDADDFGADDAEDGEDDLSDDPGEEIFFAQGETFVAIPVGPIIDDLAIQEAVPFSAAVLPSSAFLLVDKTVELQARPLRELTELGRLAADELDRQALVVFVNPRQAKRQCGRTQRVIPLPDPSLLERTAPYLMAQGITRLVIEGALYALPGA